MFRRSKFKHVFGKPLKKEECYTNIRISKNAWDSTFCAVNNKYVAIITEAAGGGDFLVLPLEKVGSVEHDAPTVSGHRAAVMDIQWCPFNDDLIASASEDMTVKLWNIPEGGITEKLTEPVVDLVAHQRKVCIVRWHPTAGDVILSAGADALVILWNAATAEAKIEIPFPDIIYSVSFNYDGSLFACTCKDKFTRVVDPRKGEVIAEGMTHGGIKPQQCVFVKSGLVFTTGFSKNARRQYALWKQDDLTNALGDVQELDQSNGVQFPFYDIDSNVVYLCGKGDSVIRYFEITEDEPYVHYLNMYQSSDPQRGIGFMPRRGLDLNTNEVARIYKLHSKGLCEVITFVCPRKSELFQDDLYPDTPGDVPALTADEWFDGENKDPVLISLKDGFKGKEKTTGGGGGGTVRKQLLKVRKPVQQEEKKEEPKKKEEPQKPPPAKPAPVAKAPSPGPVSHPVGDKKEREIPVPTPVLREERRSGESEAGDFPFQEEIFGLKETIEDMKAMLVRLERRVVRLEAGSKGAEREDEEQEEEDEQEGEESGGGED